MSQDTVIDPNCLKHTNLNGLEDICIYEMMNKQFDVIRSPLSFLRIVLRIVKRIFISYEVTGDSDFVFFASDYGICKRPDQQQYFNNLCKTNTKAMCIMPSAHFKGININILKNLRFLISWIGSFRKEGLSLKASFGLAVEILKVKSDAEMIFSWMKYARIVVIYCDILPTDYYLTYLLNRRGIDTVTVMHGVYHRDFECDDYKFSHSRYFIANCDYAYDAAAFNGKKNIIKGSMFQGIEEHTRYKHKKSFLFCLVLNKYINKENDDNNRILEFAELLAEETQMRYVVRPHPGDWKNGFNYTGKHLKRISPPAEKFDDVVAGADLVVAISSTAYFQCVYNMIPIIRYKSESGIFFECNTDDCFTDYSEGLIIAERFLSMKQDELLERRKKMFGQENAYKRYRHIFSLLAEENLEENNILKEEIQ